MPGTISAAPSGAINLNGGVAVSGTGNFSLGGGTYSVEDSLSGIAAGSLSASNGYVGNSAIGVFTHSGGTNSLGSNLYVGDNAGSIGTYNLSGSGLLSANSEIVGNYGTGIVT